MHTIKVVAKGKIITAHDIFQPVFMVCVNIAGKHKKSPFDSSLVAEPLGLIPAHQAMLLARWPIRAFP
jgi:hypothetical protein